MVAILLAGGLAYFLIADRSDLETATEEAVAAEVGNECATERSVVTDARLSAYPPLGTRAEEVVEIGCRDGEVSPIAFIYRFRAEADRDTALVEGGEKPQLCLVGREVFTLTFGAAPELCQELGGELRGLVFVTP